MPARKVKLRTELMEPTIIDNLLRLTNLSLTANGALTHSTSGNHCLDFFHHAGASRNLSQESIIRMFEKAYGEDQTLAICILLWARDARGGAGERKVFQTIARYLFGNKNYPEWVRILVPSVIPQLGYWKDYFQVYEPNPHTLSFLEKVLDTDNPNRKLLAKWFPRSGKWFVAMHRHKKISPKTLRQHLVKHTSVVETPMCANKWDIIDYSHVPSKAHFNYRKAFPRHSPERYQEYLDSVEKGETKINSAVMFPHELVGGLVHGISGSKMWTMADPTIEAQWKALPDYIGDSKERLLVMADTSGSMTATLGNTNYKLLHVSLALAVYVAQRNKGLFHGKFLTFSSKPTLQQIDTQAPLYNILRNIESIVQNTNIEAAFQVLLDAVIATSNLAEQIPTKILVISDMEFDEGTDRRLTNYEAIKAKYARHNVPLPSVIWWNLNSSDTNKPVRMCDENTAMVSGYSPSILKGILSGKEVSPIQTMVDTVGKYVDIVGKYLPHEYQKHTTGFLKPSHQPG